MKTTIEIADDLFARTQRVARREKTTFRALTEAGLRHVLKEKQAKSTKWKWKPITRGGGMTAEFKKALGQNSRRNLPGPRRMIALDTNLLVYSHFEESEFHALITEALRPIIEGAAPWALPWPCVHEFIGVVTNPRIYKPPSTLPDAFGFLEALMSAPNLQLLAETPAIRKI